MKYSAHPFLVSEKPVNILFFKGGSPRISRIKTRSLHYSARRWITLVSGSFNLSRRMSLARKPEAVLKTLWKVQEKMGIRLYIGNLSPETTEQDLQALFSEAGSVELVEVVMDAKNGRSRGFAFVTMGSQDEAEKAVSMFNGKEVNGRTVKVNITIPRGERPATSASPNKS